MRPLLAVLQSSLRFKLSSVKNYQHLELESESAINEKDLPGIVIRGEFLANLSRDSSG